MCWPRTAGPRRRMRLRLPRISADQDDQVVGSLVHECMRKPGAAEKWRANGKVPLHVSPFGMITAGNAGE